MKHPLAKDKDYSAWLKELKNKVRLVQIKVAVIISWALRLILNYCCFIGIWGGTLQTNRKMPGGVKAF
ncbi:MAG: hypothetical protein SCALA701_18170 [Candidatus Scalindua sp.]|nr:MAG: hypothetical protein SCALA701_18170 [Candidatus Scalindua sp.]